MSLRRRSIFAHFHRYVWMGGVLWILLIQHIQQVHAVPMVVTMEPYADDCFLIRSPPNSKGVGKVLLGDYELMDDAKRGKISAQPLLVYILESAKKDKIVWRSAPGADRGTFRVPLVQGVHGYWLCFQNSDHGPDNTEPEEEHMDHIPRTVGFEFRIENIIPSVKPVPALFTTDHSDEWQEKSDEVQLELLAMKHHRDYMRTREADHRALVEKTFASTLSWTLVEAVVVVAMAIGQILYFRRFLERKTYLSNHRY